MGETGIIKQKQNMKKTEPKTVKEWKAHHAEAMRQAKQNHSNHLKSIRSATKELNDEHAKKVDSLGKVGAAYHEEMLFVLGDLQIILNAKSLDMIRLFAQTAKTSIWNLLYEHNRHGDNEMQARSLYMECARFNDRFKIKSAYDVNTPKAPPAASGCESGKRKGKGTCTIDMELELIDTDEIIKPE